MKEQTIEALIALCNQLDMMAEAMMKEPMITVDYPKIINEATENLKHALGEEPIER